MKREILCPDCAPELAAVLDVVLPAHLALLALPELEGECVRLERGTLHRVAICDHCATELAAGSLAWACTMWSTRQGIPWARWEPEYIEPSAGVD